MISKEICVSRFVQSCDRFLETAIAFHSENKDVVYLSYRYHIISCNIQSGELEVIDQIPYAFISPKQSSSLGGLHQFRSAHAHRMPISSTDAIILILSDLPIRGEKSQSIEE
ncbi:unnamed protein product [Dovyalis caffra]|uniref:Uncharacterized protein n=1 Tax=Dovyalis caffra TaxID=77055 RepID=A0AAV1SMG4_9ROSI|nr:unnamed protein product [Dovyalis caffra]